jgi:cell division protein FtsI (penicillin-binding protein 3)
VARVNALGIGEVRSFEEWQRFYPDGAASAQVIGFTDIDERGQEGVESSLDALLRPQPGRRVVIRNRLGEIVDNEIIDPPQPGKSVHLTIDARIQNAAYGALRDAVLRHEAESGAAVVIDARTGELLALANWPSFEPNSRRTSGSEALRNRVVTDTFEPGSVVKPIHVATALTEGWITSNTVFDVSPGWLRLGRFPIRDVSPREALSVGGILERSSNVGMVRMMRGDDGARAVARVPGAVRGDVRRDKTPMWSMLHDVGFGAVPALPFPGTAGGRLRDVSAWSAIDHAVMAYGYGMSVSLLQLARAYTLFGEQRYALPVSLIKPAPSGLPGADVPGLSALPGFSGAGAPPLPAISAQTAREIRHMLEQVTNEHASGRRARVEGYRVGAKTGTSRKIDGKNYINNRYFATTVGLAPITAPRFVVAVMIDDPKGKIRGGGTVAAPVFSRIMAETLRLNGVPPEGVLNAQPAV